MVVNLTSGGNTPPPPAPPGSGSGPTSSGGFPGLPGMGGPVDPGDKAETIKERYLTDFNEKFKDAAPALYRDQVIEQTMGVLIGRYKSNALLKGPAGVGKTRVAEDIARRIANQDPSVPTKLQDHTIYELRLASLVSGASYVGQLEERVMDILEFFKDPENKAIAFIDEIHMLVDDRSSTYEKIAQIFKPELARGDIKVIGATTSQESRGFDRDPAFKRRFSSIIVEELTREQTIAILTDVRVPLMKHYYHQVVISDDMLVKTAQIADEFAGAGSHRPDSAITLLDRSMAEAVVKRNSLIAHAVASGDATLAASLRSMGAIVLDENSVEGTANRLATGMAAKQKLDVDALRQDLVRIKGQEEITGTLVEMLRREDLGIFPRTKPAVWLFAGPSGVGKTEVAKIISSRFTDTKPIILNMAEYEHPSSMTRIVGASPGYVGSDSNAELPFDILETNPYQVIVLDELEKSHPSVQQLFLSAFDEGYIKTAQGKVVDFSKAVIIATTNAGQEAMVKKSIGFAEPTKMTSQDLVKALEGVFAKEFLGRFGHITAFNPIDKDVYAQIVADTYARERARIEAEHPRQAADLPEQIDDDELASMVESSYLAGQGARPAVRVVRTFIEDTLLEAIAAEDAAWDSSDDEQDDDDQAQVHDLS